MYDVEKNFKYHAPKPGQPERYELIRGTARGLAMVLLANCPDSPEKTLALRKIEEAVFWANASIARGE